VTPLPVESIDGAHAVSESLVMAQAQQNAFAQAQTEAQTQAEAAAKVGLIGTSV
jgi:hypothetical protein